PTTRPVRTSRGRPLLRNPAAVEFARLLDLPDRRARLERAPQVRVQLWLRVEPRQECGDAKLPDREREAGPTKDFAVPLGEHPPFHVRVQRRDVATQPFVLPAVHPSAHLLASHPPPSPVVLRRRRRRAPSPLPPDLERVQRRRVAEEEVALEQDLLGADGIRGCCAIDRIREPLARTGGERRRKIDQRARRLSHRAAPAALPAAPDRPPRLACSG